MSITQVLESKWINKFCKVSEMRMNQEKNKGSFLKLYFIVKKQLKIFFIKNYFVFYKLRFYNV